MPLPIVDPSLYERQLADKKQWISELFSEFELPEFDLYESPKKNYRMRAEFRVWHEGDDLFYVMFEPGDKRSIIPLKECPMVSERIHDVMFRLLDELRPNKTLRFKLFQIDFLSTLSGELLVSFLYHRPIDEEWQREIAYLAEKFDIKIIGRSRKNKIVLDQDHVIETLNINGRDYRYKQVENCFTQPNAEVCRQMIHWALDASKDAGGDLVEFYCGNGNFTLPLAQNFRRVVATEIAKVSVRAAEFNIAENKIDNIDVLRMPSEDLSLILKGLKTSRKVAGLNLEDCEFSTVLVDPPRCGLDQHTVDQVKEYEHILYISCNPETLKDNLVDITKTHKIERFALFDQFPYTHHMECGVYLTRR